MFERIAKVVEPLYRHLNPSEACINFAISIFDVNEGIPINDDDLRERLAAGGFTINNHVFTKIIDHLIQQKGIKFMPVQDESGKILKGRYNYVYNKNSITLNNGSMAPQSIIKRANPNSVGTSDLY